MKNLFGSVWMMLGLAAIAAAAPVSVAVSVNTTSVSASVTSLAFVFSNGDGSATGSVTNAAGATFGAELNSFNASGTLPATVNFNYGGIIALLRQAVTLGNNLTFTLGVDYAGGVDPLFVALFLFDSNGNSLLADVDQVLPALTLSYNGTAAPLVNLADPTAPISVRSVNEIPEPSALWLVGAGLMAVLVRRR
jgi:hypothetical protein